MNTAILGRTIVSGGFAIWWLLNVVNHFQSMQGTLGAAGVFMNMSALDQEPAIATPLKRRRISSAAVHRFALVVIVIAQAALGIMFTIATWLFITADAQRATAWAQASFAASAALWFLFIISGTWFAYWLRQDALQRTHLILLATALLGMLLMQ
ncbi:MAG: DUF2165 family protein [Steroidobacteraceae bacterium]